MASRRQDRKARRNGTAELDELRPYLGLAREIHHEVNKVAADSAAPVESLVEAIGRIPEAERARVARSVFDQLPVEQQWAVLAAAFDDAELRAALADARAAHVDAVRSTEGRAEIVRNARAEQRLDTTTVRPGETLTLGLFLGRDVQVAIERGSASDAAARVLNLRREDGPAGSDGPDHPDSIGWFRVLSDAFNPRGGYFVTSTYDQHRWATEALESHSIIRVGARDDGEPAAFSPVLYPGARLDIERPPTAPTAPTAPGTALLHVGYVAIGPTDVFGS